MSDELRTEYNIAELHPRKNPYAKKLKQQITINLNTDTVSYFKALAEQTGISRLRRKYCSKRSWKCP